MNTYKVRVEIEVDAVDLAYVEVKATSVKEAKKLAKEKWEENPEKYECWRSDGQEERIWTQTMPDWEIEKI